MNSVVYLELCPANRNCKEKFTDIKDVLFNGKPIFEYAADWVNASAVYKRSGRKMAIEEITDYGIKVKLISNNELAMPAKSLSGFTRALLNADTEMNGEVKLFKNFCYCGSLFKNKQISESEAKVETIELADVDALKICVDLFCDSIGTGKASNSLRKEAKSSIKKILKDYLFQNRMLAYVERYYGKF